MSSRSELATTNLRLSTAVRGLRISLLNKRKSRGGQEVNFSEGDYVLRSCVDERRQNKLMVTHLVTGNEQDVHASRLIFYADGDLEMTDELLEHVSAQGIILKVEKLIKHRLNMQSKVFELLISWCGLESIEDSWEPLQSLAEDIPTLIREYVKGTADDQLIAAFTKLTSA
ncbi:hypothetical protein PHMEG_00034773 [Phytophthora megakarya]|uniref:Chromo domain-containing protein n=1 Tax=Phytophthora megakarya TaxID=4795 RepID=A0A225UQ57_9STRA|nr:hypothetical protein PHMEG_00034773 [Phytophthora megakarya]